MDFKMELNVQNLYSVFNRYHKFVNPFGATVQCYHETYDKGIPFNSENCKVANNLAGIKNHAGWNGEIYNKDSWEQKLDGTKYNKVSPFCKYPTWEDCCKDYATYKIPVDYPLSCASADNFVGYFCGLFKGRLGKWATDLIYLEKLLKKADVLGPIFFDENNWPNKARATYAFAKQNNRILDDDQDQYLLDWLGRLS